MSGLDHETDHNGECFPNCKECRILELEKLVKKLRRELKEADNYRLTPQEWEKKWGTNG